MYFWYIVFIFDMEDHGKRQIVSTLLYFWYIVFFGIWKITGKDRLSVLFCTFGISFFHVSQVSELLNKNINIDTMNKSNRSNALRGEVRRRKKKKRI